MAAKLNPPKEIFGERYPTCDENSSTMWRYKTAKEARWHSGPCLAGFCRHGDGKPAGAVLKISSRFDTKTEAVKWLVENGFEAEYRSIVKEAFGIELPELQLDENSRYVYEFNFPEGNVATYSFHYHLARYIMEYQPLVGHILYFYRNRKKYPNWRAAFAMNMVNKSDYTYGSGHRWYIRNQAVLDEEKAATAITLLAQNIHRSKANMFACPLTKIYNSLVDKYGKKSSHKAEWSADYE